MVVCFLTYPRAFEQKGWNLRSAEALILPRQFLNRPNGPR